MAVQREYRLTKPLLVVAGVLAIAAALVEFWPAEEVIPWRSFAEALKEAEGTTKPVFLDLYADWCGPCREMDLVTFPNDTVQSLFLDSYVPARMNIDAGEFTDSLREAWKLRAIPTSIILSPDGRELRRKVGFQSSTELILWLRDPGSLFFSSWLPFEEARSDAAKKNSLMLVVIAQSSETLENLGPFASDSTLQYALRSEFVPTYIPPNHPSTRWVDTLRAITPLANTPRGGVLFVVLRPDMRIEGQLTVGRWDIDDHEMILKNLRRYTGKGR